MNSLHCVVLYFWYLFRLLQWWDVLYIIYLRFLLRRRLKPVYFSKSYFKLFNYGKMKSNGFVEKFIFKWGRRCIFGCGRAAFELVSTLFQQVVVLVLHVEVSLNPPRGLPTCGPPKSCRPKQDSPFTHPFVISQYNGMTGKFVLPPQRVCRSWNDCVRAIYLGC